MRTRPHSLLAFSSISNLAVGLTEWESIQQTIHTYPLALDSKDFELFSKVFTPNAVANYPGSFSNLTGLAGIQTALAASAAGVDTQHFLGTTVIDIHDKEKSANSTTYFQATWFGKPYSPGSMVYFNGYYFDALERMTDGWRIARRQLVFQGPGMVGNLSLVGT